VGVIRYKIWHDLWENLGRTLRVVAIIAIGAFAVGTVLGAKEFILKDVNRAWTDSNPATIALNVKPPVDDDTLTALAHLDGIELVEGWYQDRTVRWRRSPDDPWQPALLVALEDYGDQSLRQIERNAGEWPEYRLMGVQRDRNLGVDDRIELDHSIMKRYTGTYEFEDEAIRYIFLEEDQLFSQRKGSNRFRIFPVSENMFVYDNSLSAIEFVEQPDGSMIAVFTDRRTGTKGERTSLEVPVKEETEVPLELLKEYTGNYELKPGFVIEITLEDNKLMAQATGQEKFQIFPSSQIRFFWKVVDAEIEFIRNENGLVDSVILYQGGQEIKGTRK